MLAGAFLLLKATCELSFAVVCFRPIAVEFDSNFNTLFARGSVRLRRGSQYFQASTFRYSLIQNSGELEDVYGVLELDELSEGLVLLNVFLPACSSNAKQLLPVLESYRAGLPDSLDLELGSTTARAGQRSASVDNFWDEEMLPLNTWTVPLQGEQ